MTVTLPAYYYIPWDADFNGLSNSPIQQCKRVAEVVLSFASVYSPLGRLISVSSDSIRAISYLSCLARGKDNKATAFLQCSFTIISIAGTVFRHPLGLAITAGHAALFNGYALGSSLWIGDFYSALENTLFLANNSLYIATLLCCSLEIVFISLALQLLVQGYKASQEFRKGNTLEGYAHLLMGGVRLYQIQPLLDSLLVKWLMKADLEVWRDHLSPYENIVKEQLGTKYLYFKKGDKREKFLILNAEKDPDNAFHPGLGSFLNDIEKLNERFDVKFRTISKIEDIGHEIELAAQAGKVTGLMLRAHGSPFSMEFGSDPVFGILRNETIPLGMFSKLDPECIVVLDSCSTAKDPDSSLAYELASQLQQVIYATDGALKSHTGTDLRLFSLNPLEWRFDTTSLINTKIIFPKTPFNKTENSCL